MKTKHKHKKKLKTKAKTKRKTKYTVLRVTQTIVEVFSNVSIGAGSIPAGPDYDGAYQTSLSMMQAVLDEVNSCTGPSRPSILSGLQPTVLLVTGDARASRFLSLSCSSSGLSDATGSYINAGDPPTTMITHNFTASITVTTTLKSWR